MLLYFLPLLTEVTCVGSNSSHIKLGIDYRRIWKLSLSSYTGGISVTRLHAQVFMDILDNKETLFWIFLFNSSAVLGSHL